MHKSWNRPWSHCATEAQRISSDKGKMREHFYKQDANQGGTAELFGPYDMGLKGSFFI